MNTKRNGAKPQKGYSVNGKKIGRPPKYYVPKPEPQSKQEEQGIDHEGIFLLKIERGIEPKRTYRVYDSPEYRRLEELILKMKVKDSIAIKKRWKAWPYRIVKTNNLPIILRAFGIEGNKEVCRVYRAK